MQSRVGSEFKNLNRIQLFHSDYLAILTVNGESLSTLLLRFFNFFKQSSLILLGLNEILLEQSEAKPLLNNFT